MGDGILSSTAAHLVRTLSGEECESGSRQKDLPNVEDYVASLCFLVLVIQF